MSSPDEHAQGIIMIRALVIFAMCTLLGACGSTMDDEQGCQAPAGDCYVDGMEKSSSQIRVRLIEASPGPPERGDFNHWLLEITDLEGQPIDGIYIRVDPTMPSHGHGTMPLPTATPVEEIPGQYAVQPLNLFMPGLWQIRVHVTGPGDEPEFQDFVDFEFWIES